MPVLRDRPELSVSRVMAATDLSVSGERACVYASQLASRFGATLDVVHVVDTRAGNGVPEGAPPASRAEGEHALRKLERRLNGVQVECHIVEGRSVPEDLLAYAERTSPQIICMGTRSREGAAHLPHGSTAEGVFRRSRFPVLTMGPTVAMPPSPLGFRNIVFACSFSAESRKAATFAFAFAQDSGAHIYLCHILQEDPHRDTASADAERLNALQQCVPHGVTDWCTPACVIEHGKAADAILDLAQRVHADLIVLGPRPVGFRLEMEQRITPLILEKATCPVLTVR